MSGTYKDRDKRVRSSFKKNNRDNDDIENLDLSQLVNMSVDDLESYEYEDKKSSKN